MKGCSIRTMKRINAIRKTRGECMGKLKFLVNRLNLKVIGSILSAGIIVSTNVGILDNQDYDTTIQQEVNEDTMDEVVMEEQEELKEIEDKVSKDKDDTKEETNLENDDSNTKDDSKSTESSKKTTTASAASDTTSSSKTSTTSSTASSSKSNGTTTSTSKDTNAVHECTWKSYEAIIKAEETTTHLVKEVTVYAKFVHANDGAGHRIKLYKKISGGTQSGTILETYASNDEISEYASSLMMQGISSQWVSDYEYKAMDNEVVITPAVTETRYQCSSCGATK